MAYAVIAVLPSAAGGAFAGPVRPGGTALAGYAAGAAGRTAARHVTWAAVVLAVVALLGWWLVRRRPGPRVRPVPAARRLDGLALTVGLLVTGAATFVFAALLDSVLEGGELTTPDRPVLDWLAGHRTGALTAVLRVVTDLGGTPVLPVLGLLVAGATARVTRSWRPVVFLAVVAVGSSSLSVAVKTLVARPRPPAGTALTAAGGYSFPSGHTLNTAAIVGACAILARAHRRTRVGTTVAAAILILLVGFSRLYLGVHWLTDVLAGYALGLGWLAAVATVFQLTAPTPPGPPSAPAPETIDHVPFRR